MGNDYGESGIVYEMIIGHHLMVQLVLSADLKSQLIQLGGVTVLIKEPRGMLGQIYLTSGKTCKVLMQTAGPFYTREAI